MALRSMGIARIAVPLTLAASVVLAGCSSSSSSTPTTTSSGTQTPSELAAAAAKTMASASGISATGTVASNGANYRLTVTSDHAGGATLDMVEIGTSPAPSVNLITAGGHTYFKFNEAFIKKAVTAHDKLTAAQNAQVQQRLANTWFDTATSPVFGTINNLSTIMGGFLLSGLETGLGTKVTNKTFSIGATETINGQQATALVAPDKTNLWITTADPQTLIRIAGPTGGTSNAYDLTYPTGLLISAPSPVTTFKKALGAGLFAAVLAAFSAPKG